MSRKGGSHNVGSCQVVPQRDKDKCVCVCVCVLGH